MEGTISRNDTLTSDILFDRIKVFLICVYFFASFFEPYLSGALGSIMKYYLIFVMLVILVRCKRIELHWYHGLYIFWLVYKFVSLFWTKDWYMFELHCFSQIGMIAFLIVLTSASLNQKGITKITYSIWLGSLAIGILSLFFARAYHGLATTRQVLYLFGREADPNNHAAFLLMGIGIAFYFLIKKKMVLLSLLTLSVNSFAIFLSGSRGGLIGLLFTVGLAILFTMLAKPKHPKTVLLLICISIFVLYFVVANYLPHETFIRLFEFEDYSTGSNRTLIWNNGLELLFTDANFLFGSGWGSYYGYNGFYVVLHNTFLSILCDVGIIGFICFFIPIVYTSGKLIQKRIYLPILLLVAVFVPCFFIEAVGKRYFWNSIFYLFIIYTFYTKNHVLYENSFGKFFVCSK